MHYIFTIYGISILNWIPAKGRQSNACSCVYASVCDIRPWRCVLAAHGPLLHLGFSYPQRGQIIKTSIQQLPQQHNRCDAPSVSVSGQRATPKAPFACFSDQVDRSALYPWRRRPFSVSTPLNSIDKRKWTWNAKKERGRETARTYTHTTNRLIVKQEAEQQHTGKRTYVRRGA